MLRTLKHKWRSAEAAALIESIADSMAQDGVFASNAQQFGFKIVDGAFKARPELFDGRNGHMPHRVAYAATALALTAERAPADGQLFSAVMIALGKILQAAHAMAVSLPLSPQDLMLMNAAGEVFERLANEGELSTFN
ncbi:hypothetical protein [Sedimentimonas flavescens]|uniref:hypothetical protein n=1 Tax=Sedimentimonas flavescens TaxID=2851012 RepID=UPI001C4A2C7D|nr:hypothetical protein [Sedimentimonas flavescens]MBW0159486.1 hypothetical protein [Sedimentimonas flavescens]